MKLITVRVSVLFIFNKPRILILTYKIETFSRFSSSFFRVKQVKYKGTSKLVRAINKSQKSWRAKKYSRFQGLSKEGMIQMAGGRNSRLARLVFTSYLTDLS